MPTTHQGFVREVKESKTVLLMPRRTYGVWLGSTLPVVVLLCGCGEAQARRLGADTWRVQCKSSMVACASRAEDVCSSRGFVVLSGRSFRQTYGPEGQQVPADRADLVVQCGQPGAGPSAATMARDKAWTNSPRPNSSNPGVLPKPTGRAAPTRACVPGSTQQCVGAGACAGGQTCLPDGSGFGACDCGTRALPPDESPLEEQEPSEATPVPTPGSTSAL